MSITARLGEAKRLICCPGDGFGGPELGTETKANSSARRQPTIDVYHRLNDKSQVADFANSVGSGYGTL